MSVEEETPPRGQTRAIAKRSYRDILIQEIVQALGELQRPASGLLLSGLSAGLDVGFSVFLMATAVSLLSGQMPPALAHLLIANFYSVGFIFVVVGRSELFTEHTALAVFPVLSGRAHPAALMRLWGLVYVSNVVGALAFAAILSVLGPALGTIDPAAFGQIARPLVEHPAWVIAGSALLAGWLMGLLSWLVAASQETLSQIFIVWLVTTSIGMMQLHHCILGTVEVGTAVFAGQGVSWSAFGHFLLWTTLGNSLGGVFFVALIKYGHVIRSSAREADAGEEANALERSSS